MSHRAFMGRCRTQINVSTVDSVCSVDDIRMIKKVKLHIIWHTFLQSVTHSHWQQLKLSKVSAPNEQHN